MVPRSPTPSLPLTARTATAQEAGRALAEGTYIQQLPSATSVHLSAACWTAGSRRAALFSRDEKRAFCRGTLRLAGRWLTSEP